MFLELDLKQQNAIAVIDDSGGSLSFGELNDFSNQFYSQINKRTLIFLLSENVVGALAGYVASLSKEIVPLVLSCHTDRELLNKLFDIYKPEYVWLPTNLVDDFSFEPIFSKFDFTLLKTGFSTFSLYSNLSFLLPTSGSTGSPKLVRHNYSNVNENAKNVAKLFEISQEDNAIAVLPMHYTMGLSVVTSHLYAGATVLLMKGNLTDRNFWSFIKENKGTSFTGVPYSFEILSKLRFFRMDLPDLKIITQGGGKLNADLFKAYAEFAESSGKKFIATYGQTEGTARMAYLPAKLALRKIGSIGQAIPNGELSLIDSDGNIITEVGVDGEMVYRGPNVTLGYALSGEDLSKGDENNGILKTGDIARIDEDGCFYIVGRVSRFLKLYGFRISLDELEQMIKAKYDLDCVCTGDDEKMKVFITSESKTSEISKFIIEKTGLFHKAFEVQFISEIPRNEYGKVIFKNI
jgi:acyl-coenzyme A synthetase/AMP-(fatty) acid ligase